MSERKESTQKLSPGQIAMATILGIVGISIVAASLKTSDRATMAALAAAEAPNRFLASELALLKGIAIIGESRVAARLYFGIEECFRSSHPVPLDPENLEPARRALSACARNQLGTLHAAGGPALAAEGERLLRHVDLLK